MKTEKEIREAIKGIEKAYDHVLKGSLATIVENATRALMQLTAKSKLEALYYCLGEKCPKYEYERSSKNGK